ncbi:hypothetical protein CYQ88_07425 [Hydrogenovibrio sp. SC-1]|uniref:SPOR domain-containing protein n=1 Tax=Hydrogenovibrio sp. SC-1 TaxID=2065820 RepID=UPI000C7BEE9C|nr:SPOR domain-containing protein [Hydrogenovibrio sp. SC-1]PLA74202.1 hypothetical protein CYQ88_07425 [Hydrogenovibrio sp. SC-1]
MDDSESQYENTSVKYRLTGAFFWLGLMVIIVPTWYSHPVNFDPDQAVNEPKNQSVLIEKPFALPAKKLDQSPTSDVIQAAKESDAPVTKADTPQIEKSSSKDVDSQTVKNSTRAKNSPPKSATPAEGQTVNWVIQLVAYKTKATAEALKERLKYDYDAFVKFFPKNGYYSVRVGPYQDESIALKDQARLNQLLRIESILIKGQFKNVNN